MQDGFCLFFCDIFMCRHVNITTSLVTLPAYARAVWFVVFQFVLKEFNFVSSSVRSPPPLYGVLWHVGFVKHDAGSGNPWNEEKEANVTR